jgi:hypothetical protein
MKYATLALGLILLVALVASYTAKAGSGWMICGDQEIKVALGGSTVSIEIPLQRRIRFEWDSKTDRVTLNGKLCEAQA